MAKILLSQPVPDICLAQFKDKFDITIPDAPMTYDEVMQVIGEYDAYMIIGNKGDKALLDAGKNLKAIANFGVGYDNIDWKYATEKGIAVVNTPTQVTDATAEHTVALIVAAMRGIARSDRELRRGEWISPMFPEFNTAINESTLGILGFGRIGKLVCKKAQGLGMKVIYYDKFRAAPEVEAEYGVTYMELDDVVKTADCISLHMPFIPENHHLFDLAMLKKMKKDAYLVNCARGPIVCEADLVTALKEGIIRGAGLDVYEFEPQISDALKQLDNVVLTPHIASGTMKARVGMAIEALTGLTAVLCGEIPYNVVNKEVCAK
ncbi:2-hydroxyacid dehydrogenase family protein [Selenomonas sp. TAMA-11512]|uniref:NAD(P)-dependent oxidoreductase n=1 Tax=Selenomonas sp. TAMA-11512 TaxID=3095337 RepID=UPI00308BDBE7|nr:2-hydroxyacid dehydrogenase family protein [Selenomonas sp. TAMA-11512]